MALDERRSRMLAEMGIKPVWRLRMPAGGESHVPEAEMAAAEGQAPVVPPTLVAQEPEPTHVLAPAKSALMLTEGLDWDGLQDAVAACRTCRLCERRKQAVLGVGDRQADWLFVGEGPGAEEDDRGEPFVGQAGKLLDAMLASIGLKRGENVYIANAVKCRPPGNRTPEADEMAACRPFLERQIALIRPRLIVALGRPAAQTLLGGEPKISGSRGQLFSFQGVPVIVTYHPAYLLRNLTDKAKSWEDLCFAQDTMQQLLQESAQAW